MEKCSDDLSECQLLKFLFHGDSVRDVVFLRSPAVPNCFNFSCSKVRSMTEGPYGCSMEGTVLP